MCASFGKHKHSFLLRLFPGVGLVEYSRCVSLALVEIANKLSKGITSFCVPNGNVWEFLCLCTCHHLVLSVLTLC